MIFPAPLMEIFSKHDTERIYNSLLLELYTPVDM